MHRYFEINDTGHNIRCKLYCDNPKAIRRIVLFCHGFGGHKDNSAAEKFAGRLISKYHDTALITFNWPGHGDDVKKKLNLEDCTAYLSRIIAYIQQKYRTDALYCYATSFGGYLTLKYISEHDNPFRKVALRCPAVNMYDVITRAIMSSDDLEKLRKGREIPVGFDRKILIGLPFLESLQTHDIRSRDFLEYAEDILILHGTADEIVPFDAAYAFAENHLIEFVPVEGADHRFRSADKMEQATREILNFYGL